MTKEEVKKEGFIKRVTGAMRKAIVPRVAPDTQFATLYDMGPMSDFGFITHHRIKQRGKSLRKAKIKQAWSAYPYGRFRENLDVDTIRELSKCVWVQRCITTIEEEVLSQDWEIVPYNEEDDSDHSELIEEITEFIKTPTPDRKMNFKNFWKKLIRDMLEIDSAIIVKAFQEDSYLSMDGNNKLGPQKVLDPRTPAGKLVNLKVYDSYLFLKHVDIWGDYLGVWQFNYAQEAPKFFSDREIVWIEKNPSSYEFYGWSPVQEAEMLLNTLIASMENTRDYFEDGGIPSGVMSVNMSDPDYKKLRHYWETEIKGKPSKLPIIRHGIDGGVDFIPFNDKTSDILFLDGLAVIGSLVNTAFHMTATEMSEGGGGTDMGRIDSSTFTRKSVIPILELIASVYNEQIIPEFDDQKRVKYIWIYEADPEAKAMQQQVTSERLNNFQITINEWRVSEGLDPLPWGDVPSAMLALGIYNRAMLKKKIKTDMEMMDNPMMGMGEQQGEQSNANEAPKSETNPAIQTEKPRGNKGENRYEQKDIENSFQKEEKEIAPAVGPTLTKQKELAPTETIDDFEVRALDLDKQAQGFEEQLISKVKSFFSEVITSMQQTDEVVLKSGEPADVADYFAELLNEKQLEKYVQDTITTSYALGLKTIEEEEGTTAKGITSNLKYIVGYGKIVAKRLLSTLKERIRFNVHENMSKGVNMNDVLKQTVSQVTNYARDNTLLMAKTAVYNAINVGRINKLKSMGYETYTFYTMQDRRVCKECSPYHTKTFKIDDLSKKPPLHPNCRCFIKGTKDAGLPSWIIEEEAIHRGIRPPLDKITPKMAELELMFNKSINVILAEQLDLNKSIREIGKALGTSHVSILDFKEKCEL